MGYFVEDDKEMENERIFDDVFERASGGDLVARNEIVSNNIPLVKYVVNKKYLDSGYDFDELVSIGFWGLIKAAETFDVTRRFMFSTYAVTCIDNEIKTFLNVRSKDRRTMSLNASIIQDGDGEVMLEDVYPANIDIASDYEDKECYEIVRKMVDEIEGVRGDMLRMYFGFIGDGKTLKEIADFYGISPTAVADRIRSELKIMRIKLYELGFLSTLKNEQIRLKEHKN